LTGSELEAESSRLQIDLVAEREMTAVLQLLQDIAVHIRVKNIALRSKGRHQSEERERQARLSAQRENQIDPLYDKNL
jgi:hypothetical protein